MREDATTNEVLAAATALRPRIEAAAARIEEERRLPRELITGLVDAGLFRMLIPRSLGGGELSLAAFADVVEEVARSDASTAWCLAQNAGVVYWAGFLPRSGAVEVFGQPDVTTAGGHGSGNATRVPGGYRVTGRWAFGSGMHHASWLRAQCRQAGDDDRPLADAAGKPALCVLFFPVGAAKVEDVWHVSGLRGTGSDTYEVEDLFIPEARAVQEAPTEGSPLHAFGPNAVFAAGFASVALGLARASLDSFYELASGKRGLTGVLCEQQAVQSQVGRAEATLRAARAFLHEVLEQTWAEAGQTRRLTDSQRALLRLASTDAIHRAARVADFAYTTAGATAIFRSQPFERRFRDMHAVTQQIQGHPDHYESVGRFFLGLGAETIVL